MFCALHRQNGSVDRDNVLLPEQRTSAGRGRDGGGNDAMLRLRLLQRHVDGAHEPDTVVVEDAIRVHLSPRCLSVSDDPGAALHAGMQAMWAEV